MDAGQKFRRADRRFEQAIVRTVRSRGRGADGKRARFWEHAWGMCARIHRVSVERRWPYEVIPLAHGPTFSMPRHTAHDGVELPHRYGAGHESSWPIDVSPPDAGEETGAR